MLLGCGAFLSLILMIVGGVFYEELMLRFGTGVARTAIVILSIALIAAVAKLITARAPAEES